MILAFSCQIADRRATVDVPNAEATIRGLSNEARMFAEDVLAPLSRVFKVSELDLGSLRSQTDHRLPTRQLGNSTINIFYDQAGPLIAFNRNGSLFMNL